MAIDRKKRAGLELDYRDGYNINQAHIRNHVGYSTVKTYFARFQDKGIPRGPTKGRAYNRRHPTYTGPAWIGLPA